MQKAKEQLKSADDKLAYIMTQVDIEPVKSSNSVFHDLIGCVIEQQIHYRSSKYIYFKLLEKSGIEILTPDNFQQFEALSLSGLKLSVTKLETLTRIIDSWSTMPSNWDVLGDDEVRQQLGSIKGIGAWTQDMILLYTLNRPNIFSADDFHIKQIVTSVYKINPHARVKSQITSIAKNFDPYKSLAFKYLLAYKKHLKATT